MPDYSTKTLEELRQALAETKGRLADARTERDFLGRQQGAHIKAAEFAQLDREMERYTQKIAEIEAALATKAA
jgi:hypothetical protein